MSAAIITKKSYEPISGFYNTTVNLCKMSKGLVGNFMVQIFFQDLTKYSNYTADCPLKKVKIEIIKNLIFLIFL